MNVLFISQCRGNASKATRRVLDQFAERKGDRTWQTAITWQGLLTVRKLLRQSARRNTAIICHWIKSANRTEILWIVGNIQKFNEFGSVPTNTTQSNILRNDDENQWHKIETIALLAGIAGLFHDFGKANSLFQLKLKENQKKSEPLRHEWISLCLFEAFIRGKEDKEWLEALACITPEDEKTVLSRFNEINHRANERFNPLKELPPIGSIVGWLIVSHHKLPDVKDSGIILDSISRWLNKSFSSSWNSPKRTEESWTDKDWASILALEQGTPMRSKIWCEKANVLAARALRYENLFKESSFDDRFTNHLARMVLMLSDHCYSAEEPHKNLQDQHYKPYANTDSAGKLKQKLDEHNIGVGFNALDMAKKLPSLRKSLPSITRHKGFKKPTTKETFRWQNKAYELVISIRERTKHQGFFGINMASTGCGKTLANARIMYGLANEKTGCRCSMALGLRTLTLQTGDALRKRLGLETDDLAVLVGSQAVKQLHEKNKNDENNNEVKIFRGSESLEPLLDETHYVRYDGILDDGVFSRWLKRDPRLHQLISAPILVSTIDYLMPATEGERGGKQIAPMLRLLTSDLVLDEPDDFDLDDLPALTRLVNWAGMLGSRVLLSSATLPPMLVKGLFESYRAGREFYNKSCGRPEIVNSVCCAWFDENLKPQQSDHTNSDGFISAHKKFVDERVKEIKKKKRLRYTKLIDVNMGNTPEKNIIENVAALIHKSIYELHQAHGILHKETGKWLSIGLVRMANINPMVAVAQKYLQKASYVDHRIHFCIYHSQHPLIVRSEIEKILDSALQQRDDNKFWAVPSIAKALKYPEKNHIFIVFATPVAEVGRDHDYDWAIAEPSSMRSLIQLAGRIQRHREREPKTHNLYILSKNIRALKKEEIAYKWPGFESSDFKLNSKDLYDILDLEQYENMSAIPRIQQRESLNTKGNLADLEHGHLEAKLFYGSDSSKVRARAWWEDNPTWCNYMQNKTRFRASCPQEEFCLFIQEDSDELKWLRIDKEGNQIKENQRFYVNDNLNLAERMQPWLNYDIRELLISTCEKFGMTLADASLKFAGVSLDVGEKWYYHKLLGIYRPDMKE